MGLRLRTQAQYTSFSLKGFKGDFSELLVSAEYRGLKNAVFGANFPLVVLTVEGDTRAGLGNSVLYGEWRANWSPKGSVGFGLQVELPWGGAGGVSDSHWVFLPYINAHIPFWRVFLMANLGFSQAVGGQHDHGSHDHGPSHIGDEFVFVNPHEASEFVYRLAFGVPLLEQRLQPMVLVLGQQVLVGDGEKTFVQMGLRVLGRVSEKVSVYSEGALPISDAKRFDGRVGAGITVDF